ncbi:MAG: two-component regulator propeller domain-containing protein, partial [Paludibacter sp.]
MKRLFYIFILFAGIVTAAPHLTRNYAYRYYSTRDGLAQMQVLSAFQDRDGYMWFGTKGGVSKFDGISFKNYTSDNGFSNGDVNSIGEWGDKMLFFYPFKIIMMDRSGRVDTIKLPFGQQFSNFHKFFIP